MIFKPSSCVGCVLHNPELESAKIKDKTSYEKAHAGRGFSEPDGKGSSGVVVFLESLGDNEVEDGLPVRPHAPAGSVFERVINRSPGLTRDMFKIYNTIQCQPPWNQLVGKPWEHGAIDHCQIHRDQVLKSIPMKGFKYKQRIILALGAVPFRTLTGLRGEYLNLTDIRGYPIETQHGVVIGSYHPSHIIQGAQKLMGVLMLDIRRAVHLALNGFTKLPLEYQTNPSLLDARSFYYKVKDNPNLPLAFDIETPFIDKDTPIDRIESVQFSLGPQTGIFFPWQGEYVDLAREILALSNDKIGYNNWRFDGPLLRNIGKASIGGVEHDALWAFHHYQPDLTIEEKEDDSAGISSRMGLQYAASFFGMDFPWKHMKFDQAQARFYGIADVDATQRIWAKLPTAMKRLNIWGSYEDKKKGYIGLRLGLEPVLVRMSERGIPVVETKRLALAEEIKIDKAKHFDDMQALVPSSLRNVTPKNGYSRDIEKQIAFKKGKIRSSESGYQWQDKDDLWYPCELRTFGDDQRWVRVEPFKPSNDQLIRYMKAKGYKIPTKKVKDDRQWVETGEQKELVKLYAKTKDQLFASILAYRGCETADSRYVRKWVPDASGLVHGQFLYVPANGQLNSVNPNCQNFIKHSVKDGVDRKYAERLRGMIEAPTGYKLVEFDYKSAHALTTGFEARDIDYCVAPDTNILTSDLCWKKADDIKLGDELIGFDEIAPNKKGKKRCIYPSIVHGKKYIKRLGAKITTDKGIIVCSLDHSWLARFGHSSHYRWFETGELKPGNEIAFMIKPWKIENTYDEGYVSGILDGEGCTSDGQVSFAQKEGLVSKRALEILRHDGFISETWKNNKTVKNFAITNDCFAGMRAIGKYRPVRLLEKFKRQMWGRNVFSKYSKAAIIEKIEFLGEIEVVALETTTKTFIAEGFLSHNCRLARLDFHSYVTAHFVYMQKLISAKELPDLAWSDADLIRCLGEIKKRFGAIRDTKAKPAGLGYGFGMGSNKLYQMNSDTMSLKDAKSLMKLLDDLFPTARTWRKEIKGLADRQGYLVSRYGFVRWFWDVYSRRKVGNTWEAINGSDAEDAIAFLPANDAHGHIQENMIILENLEYNELYRLINMIHDALLYLIADDRLDDAIPKIKSIMELASSTLVDNKVAPQGLSIAVDVKLGQSWDIMKEVR